MSDSDHETEHAVLTRMGAVRQPWFLPVALVILVTLPLASSVVLTRLFHAVADAAPLFALAAGILAVVAILGHSPAMYANSATGQYSLFWSPRTTRTRATSAAIALVLLGIGMAIDCLAH